MTRIALVALYPLLLLGRGLNAVRGRDPLRLREPSGRTAWVERGPEPSRASYFSEASEPEGNAHGGSGWLAAATLAWLAGWLAPPRAGSREGFRPTADRDRDIPDEVYTLW